MKKSAAATPPTKVLFVFGTRPEAIKMAPPINELSADRDHFDVRICVTGQHRQMLDDVLHLFEIEPDVDLAVMQQRQTPSDVIGEVLRRLAPVLDQEKPDWVVVQGDTTTTFAASLAAFFAKIPVAHLEAGLRTGDRARPFPEEMNRVLTSHLASLHFAPTESARANLLRENVADASIHVTGNTVIDALLQTVARIHDDPSVGKRLEKQLHLDSTRRLVLATAHRRENFGPGLEQVCQGLLRIAQENPDTEVVLPVHLNPMVREPVERLLDSASDRIHLVEPVDYLSMVYLMDRAYLIVTDSGGIQEEAPALGKPVLVARSETERPEVLATGNALLVGANADRIAMEARRLLTSAERHAAMSHRSYPFGKGDASSRIRKVMLELREQDDRSTADANSAKELDARDNLTGG